MQITKKVWLDTRTQDTVKKTLGATGNKDRFRKSTGLPVSTYFSAMKMRWLIENVKAVKDAQQKGDLCFGTIDSWLIYKMTGGKKHVTDVSNASRYMLMNLQKKQWDDAICTELGIRRQALPTIVRFS